MKFAPARSIRPGQLSLVALAAVGCAVVSCAGGCASDPKQGYSFASTYSTDIQTVAVSVFQNTTYANGIEAEIADALIKEMQKTTRWAIVSGSAADAELSGTITAAQMDRLSVQSETGMVQELTYRIRVDFEFRDNRSGRLITSRRNFEALDTFVPARQTQERLEIGQSGAAQRMARQIVAELRENW